VNVVTEFEKGADIETSGAGIHYGSKIMSYCNYILVTNKKDADPDPNHRENPDPDLHKYNTCGPTKLLSAYVSSFLVMFCVAMRGRVAV
jgi:hypothetical protein